jgi:DNA invertase Pin-like site-specific DNA recombinase
MKWATFNRISDASEKDILENQRSATRRHVESRAGILVKEYVEVESSKGITPKLALLLKDAKTGKFEMVCFTKPSRMTRGGVEWSFKILRELADAGVGWNFTDLPILNSDNPDVPKMVRDILFAVFAAIDEDYRRMVSVNTRRAMKTLKAQGKRLGGLGHHRADCRCIVHRRMAAWVK